MCCNRIAALAYKADAIGEAEGQSDSSLATISSRSTTSRIHSARACRNHSADLNHVFGNDVVQVSRTRITLPSDKYMQLAGSALVNEEK